MGNHRLHGEGIEYDTSYIAHINGVCPCERCQEYPRQKRDEEQKKSNKPTRTKP